MTEQPYTPVSERQTAFDLFEQVPALIALLRGPEGVVELSNPLFHRLWGERAVAGKPMREAWPELEGQGYFEIVEHVYNTGEPFHGNEYPARVRRGGSHDLDEAFFNFVFAPYLDATGAVDGVMIHGVEVTGQVRAKRAAEASERRYRELFENANDILYTIDLEGRITDINQRVEALIGYTCEELLGRNIAELIVTPGPETMREPLARKLAGEAVTTYELVLRAKDGSELPTEVCSRLLYDDGGQPVGVQGSARDITERRRAEAGLRERMQLAALGADVGVAFTRGGAHQETLQECAEALVRHLDAAFARIWTLGAGEVLELQASAGLYTHRDGPHGRVPVGSLKIGQIAQERRAHLTNEVIGDPAVSDQAWAKREGMVAFAGYPLLVADRLVGVMALFARRALSDAVLEAMASVANGIALGIERSRAEEALRETAEARDRALMEARDALQVRDDFLSSVSHDLRTPLTTMKGLAQLVARFAVQGRPIPTEQLAESMQRIATNVDRMQGLVSELLDVTRLETGQTLDLDRGPTDLVALVRAAIAEQQRAAPEHTIRIETVLPDLVGLWDAARLERVCANLVSNAVKYSPEGGDVVATISAEDDGTEASPWAVLSIRDEGVGIPAGDLPHVFERFYRGANVRGWMWGSGVGLAGAKQIVEQHGGTIDVESTEGGGSTFTVRLPLGNDVRTTPDG